MPGIKYFFPASNRSSVVFNSQLTLLLSGSSLYHTLVSKLRHSFHHQASPEHLDNILDLPIFYPSIRRLSSSVPVNNILQPSTWCPLSVSSRTLSLLLRYSSSSGYLVPSTCISFTVTASPGCREITRAKIGEQDTKTGLTKTMIRQKWSRRGK